MRRYAVILDILVIVTALAALLVSAASTFTLVGWNLAR
jgi:uncharacterized membrane protein